MRSKRHEAILDIISKNAVRTQGELGAQLKSRGFDVTQATLSRDISKIGLIKDDIYVLPEKSIDLPYLALSSITGVDHAMNTAVVRCRAGTANAVCAEIDTLGIKNIVGTIAGDDTIFILMRTEKDAAQLCREINDMI